MPPEIIAIGGAGFSTEPRNLALDRYILDQTGKPEPRILMIGTARGDASEYVMKFYAAYSSLGARPAHLPFFDRTPDLRRTVLNQDVIFVGGGNTRSMLAVWREWNLPALLEEALTSGVILAGVSAGAICWFEQGVTDSSADRLLPLDCLGFLTGSCCPHYDGEIERRPAYHALIGSGRMRPGYAIEDGVAVHFRDRALVRAVSKRAGATAYVVSAGSEGVVERRVETVALS